MILLMALISECSSHQNLDSLRILDHINGCGLHTRFPDARRCPHFRLHDSLIHQLLQKCTQHILYLLIWYPVIHLHLASNPGSPFRILSRSLNCGRLNCSRLNCETKSGTESLGSRLHCTMQLTSVSGRLLPMQVLSPFTVFADRSLFERLSSRVCPTFLPHQVIRSNIYKNG